MRDDMYVTTDEYKEAKQQFDELDKDLKKKIEIIRHDVRFGTSHAEKGIEIDEDYDEKDVQNIERRGGGGNNRI